MKLFSLFFTSALGQFFDNDVFGHTEDEIFGGDLRGYVDDYPPPVSDGLLGRSTGAFGGSAFGRQLPPGISLMDFVGPDGQFDISTFREALLAAYVAQQQAAAEAAGEAENEERYFFTTTTTTSTTTTTTTFTEPDEAATCWKCDQMSYSQCAIQGRCFEKYGDARYRYANIDVSRIWMRIGIRKRFGPTYLLTLFLQSFNFNVTIFNKSFNF